jgi:hypothetical protein
MAGFGALSKTPHQIAVPAQATIVSAPTRLAEEIRDGP